MKVFSAVSLFLSLRFVSAQYHFACDRNFCSTQVGPCNQDETCENGRIIPNATQCGCCDICVKALKIGDVCANKEYAAIPRTECGPGLVCQLGVCVVGNTTCMRDQMQYEKERRLNHLPLWRPKPECDDFGNYKPMSCKEGMLCFCLDKDGNRIFGTSLAVNNASVNCNCSRDFKEFRGKMARADQFLLCMENGNYDPLQCTDEYCYCIGSNGKLDRMPIHVNDTVAKLKCYDYERHKDFDGGISSKCWRERRLLEDRIAEQLAESIVVIGVDIPQCELDGSYSAVKCKDDYCTCVKRDGSPFIQARTLEETYKVERNSHLANTMNCRCAREKELLYQDKQNNAITFTFSQFECLANGNYRHLQCVDGKCFCVDDMGFQNSITVPESGKHFLDCFEENLD